jgi:predicted metal-dependent hydrolase
MLRECLADKIKTWCRKLKLALPEIEIRKMKTRWASCLMKRGKIVFNAALGRVPTRCIEYVVVHELTHFEVSNHSEAFVKLMDGRLPRWRALRKELNDFIAMPMEEV